MLILILLLTQFTHAEPPDLLPPVRKQISSPRINCALDAEGLKCWMQDGGEFKAVKGQPRLLKRAGVVDFVLSEGGREACWRDEKTVTCTVADGQYDHRFPEYWLALNHITRMEIVGRKTWDPMVCVRDTDPSGREREICAWMGSKWEEQARYLDDKWNDGPAIPGCEIDLNLRELRAKNSYEVTEPLQALGVKEKEGGALAAELGAFYRHHSRWVPSPSGGYAEEWDQCYASLRFSLPSWNGRLDHDIRVDCGTLIDNWKRTVSMLSCRKNPKLSLYPLRERRNLLGDVSFSEDWPLALELFARERGMYNVQVQKGDRYRRTVVSFTDRSGKQKQSLAFDVEDLWSSSVTRLLHSYEAFHVHYDEYEKAYRIYDRGWKLIPRKENEPQNMQRFTLEKQNYACFKESCYRLTN